MLNRKGFIRDHFIRQQVQNHFDVQNRQQNDVIDDRVLRTAMNIAAYSANQLLGEKSADAFKSSWSKVKNGKVDTKANRTFLGRFLN